MKKHRKFSTKILSIIIMTVMVVMMMPTAVLAEENTAEAFAAPVAESRTLVKRTRSLSLQSYAISDNNGTPVNPVNNVYDMLATEGWKWDKNENVLTLSGADLEVSNDVALYLTPNVTIELIGTNSITDTWTSAIHAYGDSVTIKGTGSLSVNASEGVCIVADAGSGSKPDIIIESGTIDLVSDVEAAIFTQGRIEISGGDITATGYYSGLNATGGITISDGSVTATSTNDIGIFSRGGLNISGGIVYAKGGTGKAAIAARVIKTGDEAAASQIALTGMTEKNGGKVAFCDWFVRPNGENRSWTTFIGKDETELSVNTSGAMTNALNEVWLAAPHTVTFDVDGTTSTVTVYPNSTVTAPADPTKDGSHLNGWYLDDTKFDFTTPITSDITLTAEFGVHTWNAGEITTPPTYEAGGIKTLTCTVCSQTKTEVIPKLPSNSTIVDDTTGTKAEYEDGSVFDANIVLSVISKPQAEMDKFKDSVNKAAPGLTLGGLYDIKLLKDGVAIQPDGKIKVSIPLTDKMKAMTELQVVYISNSGKVTIIPSEVKDGMITFITDHFSNYGVIGKVKAADPGNNNGNNNNGNNNNGNSDSPQTGDGSSVLPFVLMVLACGTTLVILSKKRKFKSIKK